MSGLIFKVTMENTHPPVWRRIVIPDSINFHDLHEILQDAFGWTDSHLHDYTTSDGTLIISNKDSEVDVWSFRSVDENDVLVDDIFRDYKWVRYTYDFGDDWCHKVVLEKMDPDYEERFATILKAKGDNFEEDSGGVYGYMIYEDELADDDDEDDIEFHSSVRIPFDLDYANQLLMMRRFPRREGNSFREEDESAALEKLKDMANQIAKMADMLNTLKETEKTQPKRPKTPSKMSKAITRWNEYYESCIDYSNELLPRNNEKILRSQDSSSVREVLGQLNTQEVKDYLKYLRLGLDKFSKKAGVELICKELLEHPEYCLYLIDEASLKLLTQLYRHKDGVFGQRMNPETIIKAMSIGLLEVVYPGSETCEVIFTDLADAFFAYTGSKSGHVRKTYKMLDNTLSQILPFLQVYGAIEIDALYDLLCQKFRTALSLQEYERVVYWHCRMSQMVETLTIAVNGKAVVALKQSNLSESLLIRELELDDLPYKDLDQWELKELKKGFNSIYASWGELSDFLEYGCHRMSHEVLDIMADAAYEVHGGADVPMLADMLLEYYHPKDLNDHIRLWEVCQWILAETPITALKGYSREDFREMQRRLPEQMRLRVDNDAPKVTAATHIYDMPNELLEKLSLAENSDPQTKLDILKEVCSGENGKNEELQAVLIKAHMEYGQFQEARKLANRLLKTVSKDDQKAVRDIMDQIDELQEIDDEVESFGGMLDSLWFEPEYDEEKIVPFRRETKKIGRNDPCPCGSGRKYKHCCGKNK